jgi:hypothetical protein
LKRPLLVAGFTLLALASSGVLSSCSSQDATPLANQACVQVHHALALERQATAAASPARAAHLQAVALDDVRAALPFAAEAAGDDTTWQALDATLSESNRVPLRYLLPALSSQCSGGGGNG